MKKKEIQKALGTPDEIFEEHRYNPLRIALDEEWARNNVSKEDPDYRERAVNRCLEAFVEFYTEFNTLPNVMQRLFAAFNPLTGNKMKFGSCSGGGGNYVFNYKDEETGDLIQITLSHDAIRVIPKKDE